MTKFVRFFAVVGLHPARLSCSLHQMTPVFISTLCQLPVAGDCPPSWALAQRDTVRVADLVEDRPHCP